MTDQFLVDRKWDVIKRQKIQELKLRPEKGALRLLAIMDK